MANFYEWELPGLLNKKLPEFHKKYSFPTTFKKSKNATIPYEMIEDGQYNNNARMVSFRTDVDKLPYWVLTMELRYWTQIGNNDNYVVQWDDSDDEVQINVLQRVPKETKLFAIKIHLGTGTITCQGNHYNMFAKHEFPRLLSCTDTFQKLAKNQFPKLLCDEENPQPLASNTDSELGQDDLEVTIRDTEDQTDDHDSTITAVQTETDPVQTDLNQIQLSPPREKVSCNMTLGSPSVTSRGPSITPMVNPATKRALLAKASRSTVKYDRAIQDLSTTVDTIERSVLAMAESVDKQGRMFTDQMTNLMTSVSIMFKSQQMDMQSQMVTIKSDLSESLYQIQQASQQQHQLGQDISEDMRGQMQNIKSDLSATLHTF
jgi:hypothetical protein